ncbi:MAG: hypothetical protein HRT99_02510 [Mycoplasmatales bacterium]|nr:hypothetical protein [Mycoplasmatales bacterium]
MNKKFEYKFMKEDELKLDDKNIRFFHINGYTPEESLLMIEKDSIQNLINSMNKIGFDGVFPLHINAENIVGDGNSRLLAFRIASGKKAYKKLCNKYEINGFGEIKTKEKIPVFQYLKNSDLEKFIRSTHLVDEKTKWTTAARYSYFYKMYVDGIEYDYPDGILDIVMNVSLFRFALSISVSHNELKNNLEKAYHKKLSMFKRLLINTKLINEKGFETNALNLLEIKLNSNNEIIFTDKIDLDQFKEIIMEFAHYISKNSIGQKRLDIKEFKKTLSILKEKLSIKSTEPTKTKSKSTKNEVKTKDIKQKNNERSPKVNITNEIKKRNSFFLENNIYESFYSLSTLKSNDLAGGWRERILIENIMWYLLAKALKRKYKMQTWDFIFDGKIDKIEEKHRELFDKLVSLQETISPLKLSNLIFKFNSAFKKDEINDGKALFSMNEQKFIKWITKEYSLYVENLNQAAHGRWSHYDNEKLSTEVGKLLTELIKEFNKEW